MQAHCRLVPVQTKSAGSTSKPSSARGNSEPAESEPGQARAGEGLIRITFWIVSFSLEASISSDKKSEQ